MNQVPFYVLAFVLGWVVAFLLDGLFWGRRLFRYEQSMDKVSKDMGAIEYKYVESKGRVASVIEAIGVRLDANQRLANESKRLGRKNKRQLAKRQVVTQEFSEGSDGLMRERVVLNEVMGGVNSAEIALANTKNSLRRHQQQRDSLLADIEQLSIESDQLGVRLTETIGFEEKERARIDALSTERDEKIAEIKRLQELKQQTETLYHQSLDLTLEKISLNGSS